MGADGAWLPAPPPNPGPTNHPPDSATDHRSPTTITADYLILIAVVLGCGGGRQCCRTVSGVGASKQLPTTSAPFPFVSAVLSVFQLSICNSYLSYASFPQQQMR